MLATAGQPADNMGKHEDGPTNSTTTMATTTTINARANSTANTTRHSGY